MNRDTYVQMIEGGDLAATEAALRADPTLANFDIELDRPLHIACWQKQLAIAGVLLGYGAEINVPGDNGRTPMHYALQNGDERSIPFIAALLRLGGDPSLRDKAQRTVEERAKIDVDDGLPNVLDLLKRRGKLAGPARGNLLPFILAGDVVGLADALKDGKASATTEALAAACKHNNVAIVAVLLGYGVDVTQAALHDAAAAGNLDAVAIVGLLLAAGADPDQRDAAGRTVDDVARQLAHEGRDGILALLAHHRS